MEMKDNFLDNTHLTQLDEFLVRLPWFLQEEQVEGANDGIWFSHKLYDRNLPCSDSFFPVNEIFEKYLKWVSLCRITVNCLLRQERPSRSKFHTDFMDDDSILDEEKVTTAIYYLNTNNGYTGFQGGGKIDSVRNRLVIFPTNTLHRAIGQTDVAKRIVFNFNFIKCENVTI